MGPQILESGLHLREGQHDGVELGRVTHFKYPLEPKLGHLRLALLAAMATEIVQEDTDLVLSVDRPQLLDPLLKLLIVD